MSAPQVFDVIDRLVNELPFEPAKIGEILGTKIVRDEEADTGAIEAYAQAENLADSPYETVDLRMPDEDLGEGKGFLSVSYKDAAAAGRADIFAKFGLDFQSQLPSPRYQPGSVPVYLIYQKEWGTLSFGVSADNAAKIVRFIMEPK